MPRKNGPQLLSCGYKYCFCCREPKPLAEFGRNRSNSDGHASQCKDCAKASRKASQFRMALVKEATERLKARGATGARLIDLVGLDATLTGLAA